MNPNLKSNNLYRRLNCSNSFNWIEFQHAKFFHSMDYEQFIFKMQPIYTVIKWAQDRNVSNVYLRHFSYSCCYLKCIKFQALLNFKPYKCKFIKLLLLNGFWKMKTQNRFKVQFTGTSWNEAFSAFERYFWKSIILYSIDSRVWETKLTFRWWSVTREGMKNTN